MTDDGLLRLELELAVLLRRANASSAAMARRLHPGLEASAYELISLIGRQDGVRASDLAAHVGVGRGTISRQLHRLGALGLVDRSPDPDDFRGQLLSLTPDGERLLRDAREARRAYLHDALRDWPAPDVAAFASHLEAFNGDLTRARESTPA